MHNFKELKVWQKARVLVKEVYQLTAEFPKEERFGLTGQIRRAAISIPSNIAEGCGRGTNAQLSHFLDIAQGSSCELETQLILAYDLEFISLSEVNEKSEQLQEIQKMIQGFKNSLKR